MFKNINTIIGVILIISLNLLIFPTNVVHFSRAATLTSSSTTTRTTTNRLPVNTNELPQDCLNTKNQSEALDNSLPLSLATKEPKQNDDSISKLHISNYSQPKTSQISSHNKSTDRIARSLFNSQDLNADCEFTVSRKPAIYGIRCDTCEIHDDGAIIIPSLEPTRIYLIGKNLYNNTQIALTAIDGNQTDDCTHNDRIRTFQIINGSLNVAEIEIDLAQGLKIPYYFCIRDSASSTGWFHQGSEPWLKLYVKQDILPLWGKLLIIVLLLALSGTFSGLNLGLMSLDKNDLQVIIKCGSESEKRYARTIEPLRRRGNYLLCSILFSNTLVNSTISVLLEDLSSGLLAVAFSTILIVLFGEILPQAFCSRHGLAVGAKTIWLTRACMVFTAPLSYLVSLCLDYALGDEIGHVYDRERLMEFINLTRDYNKLEADEVNIISGALKLKRIQIREIMTKIDDVYMLDGTAVLDYATIQAIVEKGYSRIPIHEEGNRNGIIAVLFAKDLALVDPDDKTPIQSMVNFYNHPIMYVFEDATLDIALNEFKSGKAHMAIVQKVINDGDRDPFYEVTGIVTLEDVIEEIMQMEINDETDTLTDNRRKRRRKDAQVRKDFSHFTNLGSGDAYYNVVSPKQSLAAYQHLATVVEPFTSKYLSDTVLKRLLSQKIFYKVKVEDDDKLKYLYKAGQPVDYFIMILEGRVQVTCGKENLRSYMGPFDCFGESTLMGIINQDPEVEFEQQTQLDNTTPVTKPALPSHIDAPRRESMIPKSNRRESLTKAITGHLSLSMKKLTDQVGQADPIDVNSSPSLAIMELSPSSTHALAGRKTYYIIPDYTVYVIADTSFMKVTTNDYITSLRATALERTSGNSVDMENNDDQDNDDNVWRQSRDLSIQQT